MSEAQRLAEWLDTYSTGDEYQRTAERAASELRRLEAECEQLRADAARYGYLRSRPERTSVAVVVKRHWLAAFGEQLDAAIDAAMKETK